MRHTASDRTPYTYVIRFPELGVLYYGAQWGRGCHPDNLGVKYFSSSSRVKNLLKHHRAIFEPRKIFYSVDDCRSYETRFLVKVNARKNIKMLNTHNNERQKYMDNAGCKNPAFGKPGTMLGRKHSEETLKRMSEVKIGKTWNIGKSPSEAAKQKSRESQLGAKSHRFMGYYHTPHGVFESSRLAALPNLNYKRIQEWCSNPDTVISKQHLKCKYLSECHIGKTFRQLGFRFESSARS